MMRSDVRDPFAEPAARVRTRMVEALKRERVITDPAVEAAFRAAPWHLFLVLTPVSSGRKTFIWILDEPKDLPLPIQSLAQDLEGRGVKNRRSWRTRRPAQQHYRAGPSPSSQAVYAAFPGLSFLSILPMVHSRIGMTIQSHAGRTFEHSTGMGSCSIGGCCYPLCLHDDLERKHPPGTVPLPRG